jgi:hypothetical protein
MSVLPLLISGVLLLGQGRSGHPLEGWIVQVNPTFHILITRRVTTLKVFMLPSDDGVQFHGIIRGAGNDGCTGGPQWECPRIVTAQRSGANTCGYFRPVDCRPARTVTVWGGSIT